MASMAMPKTPVHEDNGSKSREYQVGPTREVPSVQPESQAARMQATAEYQFRLRVATANAAHIEATLLGGQNVDHRDHS
jgi:hypothetical protein